MREVRERRLEQVAERPPAESHQARMELPLAEQVLVERRDLAITAAKLSPPDYIVRELGERPRDPEKRQAGDRGFELIHWRDQRSRLAEQQRTLRLQQGRSASLELDSDVSIGM